MATHSSILASRIPWTKESGRLQSTGSQRIGQDWATSPSPSPSFRIDWFNLLAAQGTLKSLLQHHSSKVSILWHWGFFIVQLSHPYMSTEKKHSLDYMNLCWQHNVSAFNMLSRFVTAFLPQSRWLNFMAAVTICSDFRVQKHKVCHCFHFFLIYLPWSDGTRCHGLHFLNVEFKPAFSLFSFTFIKRLFHFSSLSAVRVAFFAYLRLLTFLPAIFILSSVQFSHSVVSDSLWPPWTAARQDSLSITNSCSFLKLMSIESVRPSNHLILYRTLHPLPSIFPSIRVFSNESTLCIR